MLTRAIPAALLPYVVTIVKAGEKTDRYGNTVKDWATATRTDTRAWIEQRSRNEDTDDRDQLTSTWLLVVPLGNDLDGLDRVEYNGDTFEVVGPPDVVHTPAGPHHIEATLRWLVG